MKATAIFSPTGPAKYTTKDIRVTRFPLITVALVVANFVIWMCMSSSSEQQANALSDDYGFSPVRLSTSLANYDSTGVLAEVCRSVSQMFVHQHDFWHVGLSMVFLFVFGISVERRLGRMRFTALYLLSGALTCAAYAAICPNGQPSFGASAAICGVLGAYILLFVKQRVFSSLILLAVMALNVYCAISVMEAGFSFFAHLIGFSIGFLSTAYMVSRWRPIVVVPANQTHMVSRWTPNVVVPTDHRKRL